MNVLIVGHGKGSWQMRGVQVGAELGARVTSEPSEADWRWADVTILHKKTAITFAPFAQQYHVPIVWDVLDCWSQPRDNRWSVAEGMAAIDHLRWNIRPAAMLAATQAMARDLQAVYVPHHGRFGLQPTPARETVQVVAYDGSERYLGHWQTVLERACHARGWTFVINPPDLTAVDILIALRDGEWDGPITRAWKSGVKLTNAIAAGRPILTQPAAAFDELAPWGRTIETDADLLRGLDDFADPHLRRLIVDQCVRAKAADAVTVKAIVETHYRPVLAKVISEARCPA